MKRCALSIAAFLCGITALMADTIPVDLRPVISGVLRSRWETNIDGGLNHFAIRNARVSLKGQIARPIDYFVQVDLCQAGKFVFLDGWARLAVTPDFKIKAGQYRIPFGVDTFRSPATYIFANRSFIGKDVCNVRSVGIDVAYTFPIPLTVEAGVFNPTVLNDHTTRTHAKAYSAKATYKLGDFALAAGFASLETDSIRTNICDVGISYSSSQFEAAAEYMYKHYTGNSFKPCNAYNIWASYVFPVDAGVFDNLSAQARWEGVSKHSTGVRGDDGYLHTNLNAVDRLTIGATLSYTHKPVRCDFRVNYENYFYRHGFRPSNGRDDCVVAELVIAF